MYEENEVTVAIAMNEKNERQAYHDHVQGLHRLLSEAHQARSTQLRHAYDRLGAPNALAQLERHHLDLLLVELGFCCYCEPLARNELGAAALKDTSEAELRLALEGSDRNLFGDVRSFRLALESIDSGNGMPTMADAAQPDGSASTWSIDAVQTWLVDQQLEAATAACAEEHVNGPCLLSMLEGECFAVFGERLGRVVCRRLNEAVTALRHREAGLPAAAAVAGGAAGIPTDVEVLSEAVARALTGGEPCDFPLSYLRRCTQGFADARLVGEGSFGRVYRAVDPVAGFRFAIKRIKAEVQQHQREAADRSMRREIEVLSTLRHPHMIKLLGHCVAPPSRPGATDGECCLVYEYGVHGSLADCLMDDATAEGLGWKARVRLLTRLASVLNFLHRHSPTRPIYHRDIKSANVVLADGFEPKLIDCGLAKLLSEEQAVQHMAGRSLFTMGTAATQLLGTIGYQCRHYAANPASYGDRSEIFSFGVVLLEVMVGKLNASEQPWLDVKFVNHDALLETEEEEELTADVLDHRTGRCPDELAAPLIALAKQCLGPFRRRPKRMGEVLTALRTLEQAHCALTVEEVQTRLVGATAQAQALVEARAEERRQAELARAAAEAARQAAEATARRECCVCFDEVSAAAGVECTGREHFLCDICFGQHCFAYANEELHVLTAREARLFCPERRKQGGVWQCCPGQAAVNDPERPWLNFPQELAYPSEMVAAHVPAATFEALLHARGRIQEQQLVQQLEQRFEERMAAERRRVQELRADELRVEQTVRHIQERILTLHCPRCEAAFLDFNGCFALTCHRCRAGFCAYCLMDCGADAHAHVVQCPHRLQEGYGGDQAQFAQAQRERRQRMVREYLGTVGADIRARVMAACQRDFDDLELRI